MTAPPAKPLHRRSSGILLHPTSLPGSASCGDLGAAARHWVDWLQSAAQSWWQVLPLTPPGPGFSPYQSLSAFAGSPWLIDLGALRERGWLRDDEPVPPVDGQSCGTPEGVAARQRLLMQAWQGFQRAATEPERSDLEAFVARERNWLEDYALFMVLDARHGQPWTRWPERLARRDPSALAEVAAAAQDERGFWCFTQWLFERQWQALRAYARERGIGVIGDLPIFVAHHSADVWAQPSWFALDPSGEPEVIAGVPPDYFSPQGQRWGTPLYRWDRMAEDGYGWWKRRLQRTLEQFDVVRIDHFRGFASYWEVPAQAPTAIDGRWRPGPGLAFFQTLQAQLGPLPLIAEDLGADLGEAMALREACGYPGMRVLQFGFDGHADNPHLPHNYEPHTVAYPGTHDNDTAMGWWQSLEPSAQALVRRYLGPGVDGEGIHWSLIRALSLSVARTMIVPFQDVLGLDGRHRMNTPGLAEGCWRWRFDWPMVGPEPAARLAEIVRAHGRAP
ncbi:4-alpha-glucanotransferase [Tibeticola sp.]|uniref:4-alpha-glucanotransferase n=1 Tax=Tibeticola sp. TaxID=2005368 RepID=UPI002586F390|nr:4-alpha-glucanotransferase [Tibeticola sp.]MCI4441411.1 4-alpha-glucanotransferase [Tibeticola sp.]